MVISLTEDELILENLDIESKDFDDMEPLQDDEMVLEEGSSELNEITDPIDGGGLFAFAVLTIGIPFN